MTINTSGQTANIPAGTSDGVDLSGYNLDALRESILAALANGQADDAPTKAADTPIIPALHTIMNPDLIVNDQGQVVLIHEKPMPDVIWWVDYDPELRQLIFVTVAGQIMPFGLPVPDVVDAFLRFARVIDFIEIDAEGKIIGTQERRVVVRKNGEGL